MSLPAHAAPAPTVATGQWDPLRDPLSGDLDPLPPPGPTWSADLPGEPSSRYDAAIGDRVASPRQDRDGVDAPAAQRWLAAELLHDRSGVGTTNGGGPSRWRAADLLAGRNGGGEAPDVPATASRRAADSRDGNHDGRNGVAAQRWLAADLLETSDQSGRHDGDGHSRRRRAADSQDVRVRAPEPQEGRRPTAFDSGHVRTDRTDAGGARWQAAELLDRRSDARDREWPAPKSTDRSGAHGGADPTRAPWQAADLLGRSGGADPGAADRWAAAELLGSRAGSAEPAAEASNTWRAADAPDRRTGASSRHESPERKWLAADLLEPPPASSAGRRRRGATTHEELADDGSERRRVPTAAEPRLDERAGHLDDAEPRHRGGNRHTSSPRVPPTQWAWPKEEPDPGPFEAVRAHRGTGAAWLAADLLEEGRHTGRRRTREVARHGHPTDDDDEAAGRHYRP